MKNQLKMEVLKKEPLSREAFWQLLRDFTLIYEIVPAKGMLDRERKKIKINPAFANLQVEILMHEILHYLFPVATEWFVREKARQLVYEDEELYYFLEQYCRMYIQDTDAKSGLAGSIGIRRIE